LPKEQVFDKKSHVIVVEDKIMRKFQFVISLVGLAICSDVYASKDLEVDNDGFKRPRSVVRKAAPAPASAAPRHDAEHEYSSQAMELFRGFIQGAKEYFLQAPLIQAQDEPDNVVFDQHEDSSSFSDEDEAEAEAEENVRKRRFSITSGKKAAQITQYEVFGETYNKVQTILDRAELQLYIATKAMREYAQEYLNHARDSIESLNAYDFVQGLRQGGQLTNNILETRIRNLFRDYDEACAQIRGEQLKPDNNNGPK
jgi:hypothetical protein